MKITRLAPCTTGQAVQVSDNKKARIAPQVKVSESSRGEPPLRRVHLAGARKPFYKRLVPSGTRFYPSTLRHYNVARQLLPPKGSGQVSICTVSL